jgi:hypothetical protein
MSSSPGFACPRAAGSLARRLCLAFILVSVICAQALGFMHGIVHTFHVEEQQAGQASTSALAAPEAAAAHEEGDWIESLFAQHGEAQDCRMFDGVGHQSPMFYLPLVTPVLTPCASLQRLLAGAFVARWAALFEARAPPPSH